ncbi:MAG: hypothetical protein VST71_04625 [Nitrospirota bacterium]|nr:hypothetical protein [Nitrospirota bacterium]
MKLNMLHSIIKKKGLKKSDTYQPIVFAVAYVLLSLFVAYVTFGLLSSTGSLSGKGYTFGGAAAGFFFTLLILMRFHKQTQEKTVADSDFIVGTHKIRDEKDYSEQYISKIIGAILEATSSIKLHFPMLQTSSNGDVPKRVNEAIRNMATKIPITIITCAEYDRVAGAYELNLIKNLKLYFSSDLKLSDLRFTLIDEEDVVIGVNSKQHEKDDYHHSLEWVRLRSIKLAGIINDYFMNLCEKSIPYENYVAEIVRQYTDEGTLGNHRLAAQKLDLPQEEIERIIKLNTDFREVTRHKK